MEVTFMIIDDDIAVGKILEQIIKKNNLGRVLSILSSGKNADEAIIKLNPDILLIDLLLPGVDGIEIVKGLNSEGFNGKMIMISQVEDEEMISSAYKSGVLFYINKPINMIETISVINNVKKQVELEQSIKVIKNMVFPKKTIKNIDERIIEIFSDIDIIGTSGTEELKLVILHIIDKKQKDPSKPYKLKEIYIQVSKEIYGSGLAVINCKSMEQRIRRTITKGMNSVANIVMEEPNNKKYKEYASSLFEFNQVKQEIEHIKNPLAEQGKINTKKFVEGILLKLLND